MVAVFCEENPDSVTEVVIPATVTYNRKTYTVTAIRSGGFESFSEITTVTLPSTIIAIGAEAFYECEKLSSVCCANAIRVPNTVCIPSSVSYVGKEAFAKCSNLNFIIVDKGNPTYDSRNNCNAIIETSTNQLILGCSSTTIPNTVTTIGRYAFADCSDLTTVQIPNSVTTIAPRAFAYCDNLASINIASSVTDIGEEAFFYCRNLSAINIESSNPVYDSRNNCNALIETKTNTLILGCQSTVIPHSVTTIRDNAFAYCSYLSSIIIPNSVTTIGYGAFAHCLNLTSVKIPNSVTSIGSMTFNECTNLTAVRLPDSLTTIGSSAFYECTNLFSIKIPNSVTTIGNDAFCHCEKLTSVHIPKSVTSIGQDAFSYCENLASITVDTENPFYDSRNNCNAIIETKTNTLLCGCQSTLIPNTVTSIGPLAFHGCSGLTSITIPESVTFIGYDAFQKCEKLTSVHIPKSVTTIETGILNYCESVTAITVDTANPAYDSRDNCNAIIATKTNTLVCGCQNTIIPNTVTAIGFYAFYGCSGLTSITIPESVTSIEDFAFDICKNLPTVHIPKSVTSIGPRVFMWDIRDKITIDPDNPVYGSNYNGGKSKPLD